MFELETELKLFHSITAESTFIGVFSTAWRRTVRFSSPHWVVVKGYDKDAFYINDPYSNSTISIDTEVFKAALGFDNDKQDRIWIRAIRCR